MSLSGLFLILFLLVHLGANLTVFGGESAYNAMCEFMDTNIFIRIMVPVLALGFIIHILYAFIVTLNNRKARGNMRYAVQDLSKSSTWESRNMLVLGIIVLGIIIIHLFDFWSQMQLQHFIGGTPTENPYELVIDKFSNPLFHTVGLDNQIWISRWKCIAKIYALVVAVGFTIIPLYVLAQRFVCGSL